MSSHFELLAQREPKSDEDPLHNLPFTVRSAEPRNMAADTGGGNEEMLRLVQRVFLSANGSAPRQVAFCGLGRVNGSASVCAGVARALAANISKSVCLIDANSRSPRLSSALGLGDTSSLFQDRVLLREGCVQIDSNLWFGGMDAAANEIGSLADIDKLKERLTRLHSSFDFVLIDVPGTNLSDDAAILGRLAGAIILVIDAHRTRREAARSALETLETTSGITVLGTVLYNRSFPIPGWVYKRL